MVIKLDKRSDPRLALARERRERVMALYLARVPVTKIAALEGVTRARIYQILHNVLKEASSPSSQEGGKEAAPV